MVHSEQARNCSLKFAGLDSDGRKLSPFFPSWNRCGQTNSPSKPEKFQLFWWFSSSFCNQNFQDVLITSNGYATRRFRWSNQTSSKPRKFLQKGTFFKMKTMIQSLSKSTRMLRLCLVLEPNRPSSRGVVLKRQQLGWVTSKKPFWEITTKCSRMLSSRNGCRIRSETFFVRFDATCAQRASIKVEFRWIWADSHSSLSSTQILFHQIWRWYN